MTLQLEFGDIIWAEIADANGIRKERPVVIITPDVQITPAGILDVVAITSMLSVPLPDDHVLLPWHAQGHPRTGLNRKSAAVCSWMAQVSATEARSVVGFVPGPLLIEIMSKLSAAPPA